MPTYRVKLQVTITTKELLIKAKDRQDLGARVDNIDLRKLLGGFSDGLHVAYMGDPQRVFDGPESDIEYEDRPKLTEGGEKV